MKTVLEATGNRCRYRIAALGAWLGVLVLASSGCGTGEVGVTPQTSAESVVQYRELPINELVGMRVSAALGVLGFPDSHPREFPTAPTLRVVPSGGAAKDGDLRDSTFTGRLVVSCVIGDMDQRVIFFGVAADSDVTYRPGSRTDVSPEFQRSCVAQLKEISGLDKTGRSWLVSVYVPVLK